MDEAVVAPEIQGEEIGGQFSYDKALVANLVPDDPNLEQEVFILYADSPCGIFVCPKSQIGSADQIFAQVNSFAGIDPDMVGYGPTVGKLCLAKSMEDGQWYRGACIGVDGPDYVIFFVDFGFQVRIPASYQLSSGQTVQCFHEFSRKNFRDPISRAWIQR